MDGIVIALIVIFAVIAVVFLALAIYHFAAAKKEDPTEEERPEREEAEVAPEPLRSPEPVKAEKKSEATEVEKIVERASQRYRENAENARPEAKEENPPSPSRNRIRSSPRSSVKNSIRTDNTFFCNRPKNPRFARSMRRSRRTKNACSIWFSRK